MRAYPKVIQPQNTRKLFVKRKNWKDKKRKIKKFFEVLRVGFIYDN